MDGVDVGAYSKPVFVDLDGDRDSDLVVGSITGRLHYFENTGTVTDPLFTQRTGSANPLDFVDVASESTPAFVDLDGDDDLDLVVGYLSTTLFYFENTGTPEIASFAERTGAANPFADLFLYEYYDAGPKTRTRLKSSAPAFADLDDDQDPYLIVGYDKGDIIYYENTGTATEPDFTLQTHTGTANLLYGAWVDYYGTPAFIDLDNDGDLDLVAGDRNGALNYLENTGITTDPDFSRISLTRPVTFTIYDSGGIDTLDLRTDTTDQRVDLNPEGISDVYGLVGAVIIARGTWIENFIAGSGNDLVIGNATANHLQGNDELNGGAGNDTLEGGAGADRLDGGPGTNRVSYRGSDAGVTVNLAIETGQRGHAEGDVIINVENITGSSHPDILTGNDIANHLDGGPGNDTLQGSSGDDVLEGGAGADRLDGGAGTDRLSYAGSAAGVMVDLLAGTAGGGHAEGDVVTGIENVTGSGHNDSIAGDNGANHLDGGDGDDALYGGSSNDKLWGGNGNDRMTGGDGTDELWGEDGDDQLDGESGDDRLFGGMGNDGLGGQGGADWLEGGDGEDDLSGGPGDDVLKGGAGDDMLRTDSGADLLDGGPGIDTVDYWGSSQGVTVNLQEGTGKGGSAEGDIFVDIEHVRGSNFGDDILVGNSSDNRLLGENGNDQLRGG